MKRLCLFWLAGTLVLLSACSSRRAVAPSKACSELSTTVDGFKSALLGEESAQIGFRLDPIDRIYYLARQSPSFTILATGNSKSMDWSMRLNSRYYEAVSHGKSVSEWPTDGWISTDHPKDLSPNTQVLNKFLEACEAAKGKYAPESKSFVADGTLTNISEKLDSLSPDLGAASSVSFLYLQSPYDRPLFEAWQNQLVLCDLSISAICE